MVDTGKLKAPSDWQTERNPVTVAVIGKLGEEAAELSKICHRATIQGIVGHDPKNDKPNEDAIFEEMADTRAMSILAEKYFGRTIDPERVAEKLAHKEAWLKLIRA